MVGRPTPSYKNHRALDDKAGVITAVKTTTGAVDEASELFELIERHERVTASKTKVAVADSRYGNTANLIALAQGKIRAHVADLRSKMRNPRSQGIYFARVLEASADHGLGIKRACGEPSCARAPRQ